MARSLSATVIIYSISEDNTSKINLKSKLSKHRYGAQIIRTVLHNKQFQDL